MFSTRKHMAKHSNKMINMSLTGVWLDRLAGQLGRMASWLAGWLAGQLAGWRAGWLDSWLAGLAGWAEKVIN